MYFAITDATVDHISNIAEDILMLYMCLEFWVDFKANFCTISREYISH